MLDLILKWAVPFVLTSLIAFLSKTILDIKKLKNESNVNHEAMRSSLVALVRGEIINVTEKYFTKGYLPDHARLTLQELFDNYKVLGGNHGIDELVANCFKLMPIGDKETGKNY
jgi:hypothetical protein